MSLSDFRGWFDLRSNEATALFAVEVLPVAPSPEDGQASKTLPRTVTLIESGISVAFRGEIHGLSELHGKLGLSGGTSAASVVLAAWRRWSTDFVSHIDGPFVVAIHAGDELWLYRDSSGLQNLYWCHTRANLLAFATSVNALLQLPGVPRRLARHSIHEYLRFLDIAPPNTLFEDVWSIEPGQLVSVRTHGVVRRSRPLVAATSDAPPTHIDAAVETLDGLLRRSLESCLADTVSPAAFLSSGVDSSLICALAHRHRSDTVALTVAFDGMQFDESPLAARIAAHLGMQHRLLRFDRKEYLSAFNRLSLHMEQPMADPATPATLLAFDHCRRQFDTVLDGTGADEAVGAVPPRHVRLAVGYASLLPRGVRSEAVRLLRAVPALSGYTPILDFEHPADTMIRWRGFTRPEIEELCGEPVSFERTQFYRTFAKFPRHAHFERYSALLDAMPSDRLSQASLISGMPVRFPFFDAETNRFIRQLRTDLRYLPGEPKRILRSLLARYVPREIWDVPKRSFDFPLHEFLSADDFQLVHRYLDVERWRHTRLLSPEGVQRYARQYIAGDQRHMFRVWALVTLAAWLEKHNVAH